MKRIGYSLLAVLAFAAPAWATVSPNGAHIVERVYNDCPSSILITTNAYPALISFNDTQLSCFGFANRHVWNFSSDGGATEQKFRNRDQFSFSAYVVIDGTGDGESGLRISPWWSPYNDGMFNIRVPDGEIAVFSGRLPFYSFTASHGITYVKGTAIKLSFDYIPNDVSAIDPGTIIYTAQIGANVYSSGPLAFDHANPAEDPPYGVWGILNDARAGGHAQFRLGNGTPVDVSATWRDIVFEAGPTPAEKSSWGKIKADYR